MDKMKLFEAINMIDDDIIEDAAVKSEKTTQTGYEDTENSVTVSGVEVYKRSKWRRFASVAAALMIVAALGSAGAMMFRHNRKLTGTENEKPATSYSGAPTTEQNGAAAVTTGTDEDTTEQTSSDGRTTEDTSADSVTTETQGTETEVLLTSGTTGKTVTNVTAATGNKTTSDNVTETEVPLTTGTTSKTVTKVTTASTENKEPDVTTTKKEYILGGDTLEVHMAPGEVYKWFDWGDSNIVNIIIASMGDHRFTYKDDSIFRQRVPGDEKNTFPVVDGFSIMCYNAYFADISADGWPELCISASRGSGMINDVVYIYDIFNDKLYSYDERFVYDFTLTKENNRLYLLRRAYSDNPVPWSEADRFEPVLLTDDDASYIDVTDTSGYNINDIDGDGEYKVSDAHTILTYVALSQSSGVNDPAMESKCDVDGNGAVTVLDAAKYFVYLKATKLPGDINEDGAVDSTDRDQLSTYVTYRNEYSRGSLSLEEKIFMNQCETYGDLNRDGEVDDNDLRWYSQLK